MEIKTYNSSQLKEFIGSQQFLQMPAVPISTHRALSHIVNPRAEPDDILILIAFENGEMAGYLGVLPDIIYSAGAAAFKCGFLSCLWINPSMRGKGIAKKLLSGAFDLWNDCILATEFTEEAKALYFSSGNFTDLKIMHGLRCYRRFNLHEILPQKSGKWQPVLPLLKLGDALANIPNDFRLKILKRNNNPAIRFALIEKIDEALNNFILLKQNNNIERRSSAELNWIIQKPWILTSAPTAESNRYYFSSVEGRFKNLDFKLFDEGKLAGFLMCTIRKGHLKIPYAFFDEEIVKDVAQFIYWLMQEEKIDMLTVFNSGLANYIRQNATPFIYKKGIKRHFIISKKLAPYFPNEAEINIQDGDADCAFT